MMCPVIAPVHYEREAAGDKSKKAAAAPPAKGSIEEKIMLQGKKLGELNKNNASEEEKKDALDVMKALRAEAKAAAAAGAAPAVKKGGAAPAKTERAGSKGGFELKNTVDHDFCLLQNIEESIRSNACA